MARITSQQVLEGLKENGINNLQELASFLEKVGNKIDDQGNPMVADVIISPGFLEFFTSTGGGPAGKGGRD
jgi:hypothetical protein